MRRSSACWWAVARVLRDHVRAASIRLLEHQGLSANRAPSREEVGRGDPFSGPVKRGGDHVGRQALRARACRSRALPSCRPFGPPNKLIRSELSLGQRCVYEAAAALYAKRNKGACAATFSFVRPASNAAHRWGSASRLVGSTGPPTAARCHAPQRRPLRCAHSRHSRR